MPLTHVQILDPLQLCHPGKCTSPGSQFYPKNGDNSIYHKELCQHLNAILYGKYCCKLQCSRRSTHP